MKEGEYTFTGSGNVYKGKFDDDGVMNDEEATITFATSGNIYEGPVVDGLMSGEGKLTWAE